MHLSWTVGLVTLVGSGSYVFVYLSRWEWHRALLAAILFLVALVVLSLAVVLRRIGQLQDRLTAQAVRDREPRVLRRLHEAPVAPSPFPWLRPEDLSRTSIFIPVLLGSGVVVSGLAWLVERLAGSSARAGVERELARDLGGIAYPTAPLVPAPAEAWTAAAGVDSPGLRLLLGPPSAGAVR